MFIFEGSFAVSPESMFHGKTQSSLEMFFTQKHQVAALTKDIAMDIVFRGCTMLKHPIFSLPPNILPYMDIHPVIFI